MADRSGDDKTAIENKQNLIVDGYYIPFDWEKNFTTEYLQVIKYFCFVMSENYIKNHISWFLKNHQDAIDDFMKEVKEKYYDKMKETNQLYLFKTYTSYKCRKK